VVYGCPMDATTKTAAAIFEDQLTALELLFGLEFEGSTPGERIASLGVHAKADPALAASLKSFFSNPIHFAEKFKGSDGSLFNLVTKTLLATAVRGVIHDYGPMGAPRRQHWMPFTYLKNFCLSGHKIKRQGETRSVVIPGVNFAEGSVMDFETSDANFIHPKVNGMGFYEDGAEFFFSLVEGLYAQGRSQEGNENKIDQTMVALFFIVQSVRNPRRGASFVHSTLSSIVDAVLANIDAVGPRMQARFLRSGSGQLPFTPYVPPFVDRFGSERVYSSPVSLRVLFSLSSGELDEESWAMAPFRYRRGVIRQAQRRGGYIFGVHKDKIAGLI